MLMCQLSLRVQAALSEHHACHASISCMTVSATIFKYGDKLNRGPGLVLVACEGKAPNEFHCHCRSLGNQSGEEYLVKGAVSGDS